MARCRCAASSPCSCASPTRARTNAKGRTAQNRSQDKGTEQCKACRTAIDWRAVPQGRMPGCGGPAPDLGDDRTGGRWVHSVLDLEGLTDPSMTLPSEGQPLWVDPASSARTISGTPHREHGFRCGVGPTDQHVQPAIPSGSPRWMSLNELIDDALSRAPSIMLHSTLGALPTGTWSGAALTRNLRRQLHTQPAQSCQSVDASRRAHGIGADLDGTLAARNAALGATHWRVHAPPTASTPVTTQFGSDLKRTGRGPRGKSDPGIAGTLLLSRPGIEDPTRRVEFHMGDVHLTFPLDWLYSHWEAVLNGTAPSQEDVVETIWNDSANTVRAKGDAGSSWAEKVMDKRIGCVNILLDPGKWLFYREGGGAPEAVIVNTLRMIHAHVENLDDRFSNTSKGQGYPEFWDELLGSALDLPDLPSNGQRLDLLGVLYPHDWPGPARSPHHAYHPGERRDALLHFASIDGRYSDMKYVDIGDCGTLSELEYDLVAGWNAWDEGLIGGTGAITLPDTCPGMDPPCIVFNAGETEIPSALAIDSPQDAKGHAVLRARRLHSDAEVADELMFWARAALSWYWESASWEQARDRYSTHFMGAWWLGRFTLRYLLRLTHPIIHEFAHVFNMTGHCPKGCFMDTSAYEFQTAMIARYGLPLAGPSSRATDPHYGSTVYLNSADLPRSTCTVLGRYEYVDTTAQILASPVCAHGMGGVLRLEQEGNPGADRFLCVTMQNIANCSGDSTDSAWNPLRLIVPIADRTGCASIETAPSSTPGQSKCSLGLDHGLPGADASRGER